MNEKIIVINAGFDPFKFYILLLFHVNVKKCQKTSRTFIKLNITVIRISQFAYLFIISLVK